MISYGQLETRVRTLYEATTSARWSSDQFLRAANEALDELSEATRFYERRASVPLKGRQVYYDLRGFWPQDAFGINAIWNVDQQIWLRPAGLLDLKAQYELAIGAPIKYVMRGLFWMMIHPRPSSDTGTLRVHFCGHAPHFRDSSSVLYDLPDDLMPGLESYVLHDLSIKDGETEKAMKYWTAYRQRESELASIVRDRITAARTGRMGHGGRRSPR